MGSFLVIKVKNHSSHTCRMTCGQDIKHKTVWKKEHTQYTCIKLVLTYISRKLKTIEFNVMTEDYRSQIVWKRSKTKTIVREV